MKLAGTVFLVDGIKADGIPETVPARMEIAAKIAGYISLKFHIKGGQDFTFISQNVINNQRLVQFLFAVGGEPVLIRREAAVSVEIQKAVAESFIIGLAISEKVVTLSAVFLKGCDDLVIISPVEMRDTTAVWDYLAKFIAVEVGGEHTCLETTVFFGPAEKEKAGVILILDSMVAPHMAVFEFRAAVLDEFVKIED